MLTAATPTVAMIAMSRMTPIGMNHSVAKPTTLAASAEMPGTHNVRKARRDAVTGGIPWARPSRCMLTTWMPWLTAIAKTRKGTIADSGFMPPPAAPVMPSCQITVEIAVTSSISVGFQAPAYQRTRRAVTRTLIAKKASTACPPSTIAPTSGA